MHLHYAGACMSIASPLHLHIACLEALQVHSLTIRHTKYTPQQHMQPFSTRFGRSSTLLQKKEAHTRRNMRPKNGAKPWRGWIRLMTLLFQVLLCYLLGMWSMKHGERSMIMLLGKRQRQRWRRCFKTTPSSRIKRAANWGQKLSQYKGGSVSVVNFSCKTSRLLKISLLLHCFLP